MKELLELEFVRHCIWLFGSSSTAHRGTIGLETNSQSPRIDDDGSWGCTPNWEAVVA